MPNPPDDRLIPTTDEELAGYLLLYEAVFRKTLTHLIDLLPDEQVQHRIIDYVEQLTNRYANDNTERMTRKQLPAKWQRYVEETRFGFAQGTEKSRCEILRLLADFRNRTLPERPDAK